MDEEGQVCLSSEDLDGASPQCPGLTLNIEQSHGQLSRHPLAPVEETMLAPDETNPDQAFTSCRMTGFHVGPVITQGSPRVSHCTVDTLRF